MPQELNFEGGPWKLRNGTIIDYIESDSSVGYCGNDANNHYYEWNFEGNHVQFDKFDIVESCKNWKYMREHGLEE